MSDDDDRSNGYDDEAERFMAHRSGIGAEQVGRWARSLSEGAVVLDLGCGSGGPITEALSAAGVELFGVDASPRMVAEFRKRWPAAEVECAGVESSTFFERAFDGVLAWGLLFLLPPETQERLIHRVASVLAPGGRFLFTAPSMACRWEDALTGRGSISLGAETYRTTLESAGLTWVGEEEDEGGNHYYHARAPAGPMSSA